MRIAVLGDAHLIADDDPYKNLHEIRGFFKSAWPSYRDLIAEINGMSPDLVVMLGDLVDWFSPENMSFGLELMSELHAPWKMTPGNHDIASPSGDPSQDVYKTKQDVGLGSHWNKAGVIFGNREIDCDGLCLLLMDSPLSRVQEGTEDWLNGAMLSDGCNILLTHVPIDTPEARDYILSVDGNRSMAKYVLSGAPDLYRESLKGRVDHVFSGHLHFSGDLVVDTTDIHLCDMSISMHDPHRNSTRKGTAYVIDWDGRTCASSVLCSETR
jgi:3',5'-cyclic AMP phosphodiesterase CpdA